MELYFDYKFFKLNGFDGLEHTFDEIINNEVYMTDFKNGRVLMDYDQKIAIYNMSRN